LIFESVYEIVLNQYSFICLPKYRILNCEEYLIMHLFNALKSLLKPSQKSSTRTRTLLIAAGLSVSALAPVYPGIALQKPASSSKPELISQNQKPLELTLVSYAVTKEAYSRIIPLFVKNGSKSATRT
jgi:sulfate transport system substrate-binding protein